MSKYKGNYRNQILCQKKEFAAYLSKMMTFIQGLGSATRINCFEGHHLHSKVLNSQQKCGCCGFIFIDHFNSEVAVWMVEEAFWSLK